MKTYGEARDFLYSLRNKGSKYGLQRMVRFMQALGNPQESFPVIHVAGTNGKGSVCALTESILRKAGYKTGLYTSPHLVKQGERIQVNRIILSDANILQWTLYLRPYADELAKENEEDYPSFFEFMTAMAFLVFAEKRVDIAIVETGLGGRLDATNVVQHPLCTAITSIDLDHTDILGDTVEKIAAEKAGICKQSVPLILGMIVPAAEKVICRKAVSMNCPLRSIREIYGTDMDFYPETNLEGVYQRANAAMATEIIRALPKKYVIGKSSIRQGLLSVDWPGRWQRIRVADQEVILDCTHNPEGARMLQKQLQQTFGPPSARLFFLFGSVGIERARAILEVICPYARKILLVRPNQPHALTFADMKQAMPSHCSCEMEEKKLSELIPDKNKFMLQEKEPVVVTGSIYLIGELCELVQYGEATINSLQDSPIARFPAN